MGCARSPSAADTDTDRRCVSLGNETARARYTYGSACHPVASSIAGITRIDVDPRARGPGAGRGEREGRGLQGRTHFSWVPTKYLK
jgi:hypothetical protein